MLLNLLFCSLHDYLQIGEVQCVKYDEPVKMANVFEGGHARVLSEISCMTSDLDTGVRTESWTGIFLPGSVIAPSQAFAYNPEDLVLQATS